MEPPSRQVRGIASLVNPDVAQFIAALAPAVEEGIRTTEWIKRL